MRLTRRWTREERLAYRRSLPTKRIVGSLVAWHQGRLLIVKPTYRSGWLLPGGVVEANESPAAGCIRETLEELGLQVELTKLLLIDHAKDTDEGGGGCLHFWFAMSELTTDQLGSIKLPEDELEAYRLVSVDEAFELLIPRLATRLRSWLRSDNGVGPLLLEEGLLHPQQSS